MTGNEDNDIQPGNDPGYTGAPAPLLSWDIFMAGYQRKMKLLDDAKMIHNLSKQSNWKHGWDFRQKLLAQEKVILVTDPSLQIVCASSNLFEMNGYDPHEVVGQKPSMFQGAATTESSRWLIRSAIQSQQPFDTNIINYKKNGTLYDCHIEGYPVFNAQKELVHFIAFENAV
jgi:PAS domain S-box-containing protein